MATQRSLSKCHSGLTAILPLWKQNRKALVLTMLEAGIESIIVSCNATMGETFLGRAITTALVSELETLGVDPCGENGEYHTLVVDCPLFSSAMDVAVTGRQLHANYWFAKLERSDIKNWKFKLEGQFLKKPISNVMGLLNFELCLCHCQYSPVPGKIVI